MTAVARLDKFSPSAEGVVRTLRSVLAGVVALAGVVVLWEGYKWMGGRTNDHWPGTSFGLPVRTNDLVMPHASEIWGALWDPVQRGRSQTLAGFLFQSARFTFSEAALGFFIGTIIGLSLAVLMLRFSTAERGLMPWINISQTVPLIALAPIIVTWGRSTALSDTQAVSIIATYLTFFPVAVNALQGLQSPDQADLELMRSYASPWRHTLWKLRVPAARPYLFPAFKLAATLSVVGAIVGEISAGVRGGLGRAVLNFATIYSTGPEKLYASVLAAAMLGLFVFALVSIAERIVDRNQIHNSNGASGAGA